MDINYKPSNVDAHIEANNLFIKQEADYNAAENTCCHVTNIKLEELNVNEVTSAVDNADDSDDHPNVNFPSSTRELHHLHDYIKTPSTDNHCTTLDMNLNQPTSNPEDTEVNNSKGSLIKPEEIFIKEESMSTSDAEDLSVSHEQNFKQGKSYSCNLCQFQTVHRRNISTHMRIHTGVKPYACSMCEFRAAQKGRLQNHMRTHTGEKPYACTFCEFRASQKHVANNHMRTHTGEKPYACNNCSFKTVRKDTLSNHMRIHTGEKLYSRVTCSFKTAQRKSLDTHKKTHVNSN